MLKIRHTDKELLRAKRWSRVVLVLAFGGLLYALLHQNPQEVRANLNTKVLELRLEQIVYEEPLPEPVPEPQPPVPEVKTLTTEESDFKAEVAEPKPEEEPVVEPEPQVIPEPDPLKKEEIKKPEEPSKPKVKPIKKQPVKVAKKVEKAPTEATKAVPSGGNPGSDVSATTAAVVAAQKNQITALLLKLIEQRKRYPKAAKRAGLEGLVTVEFAISREGKITAANVIKNSGISSLDKASSELADKIVGTDFKIANNGLKIRVPIRYMLSDG